MNKSKIKKYFIYSVLLIYFSLIFTTHLALIKTVRRLIFIQIVGNKIENGTLFSLNCILKRLPRPNDLLVIRPTGNFLFLHMFVKIQPHLLIPCRQVLYSLLFSFFRGDFVRVDWKLVRIILNDYLRLLFLFCYWLPYYISIFYNKLGEVGIRFEVVEMVLAGELGAVRASSLQILLILKVNLINTINSTNLFLQQLLQLPRISFNGSSTVTLPILVHLLSLALIIFLRKPRSIKDL